MLVLDRRDGEVILIYPAHDLDPNMTVKELFGQPIKIKVYSRPKTGNTKVCIDAPRAWAVVLREELETA